MAEQLTYTGSEDLQPQPREQDEQTGQLLYPYLPEKDLVEAVNLAIFLQRPLFLRGEPGCGKTRLARAVAYELKLPYESWHVKSTSRAQDGLYAYDAVRRLHDVQLSSVRTDDEELQKRIDEPEQYISWGPLGRAFQREERTVVLIDEIDKADIDFPNDLLLELDEGRFEVKEFPEGKRMIQAKIPPIVFITSNDEKELPDAFLRRCIFHYIEFPNREQLRKILNAHFPVSFEELLSETIDTILSSFLDLREKIGADKQHGGKNVSTSELLDWFKVLKQYHPDEEIVQKLSDNIPLYPGVLVKNQSDYQKYVQKDEGR